MSVVTKPVPRGESQTRSETEGSSRLFDDRRCAVRMRHAVSAAVRPIELSEPHRCDVKDISEGGMLVCVPLSYGLNVGQRCEVRFAEGGGTLASEEPHYATVVRTEVVTAGDQRLLGAGLRFDQPIYL